MILGAQIAFSSLWVGIAVKLGLMLAFVPLFFSMRVMTPDEVLRFVRRRSVSSVPPAPGPEHIAPGDTSALG
jgi:hypothetical protein